MRFQLYQVDAFTGNLFSGNPAAVVPLDNWLSDEQMQAVAAENNLSETAFFVDRGNYFQIRWFTPQAEVDLCGHATLAAAWVIFQHIRKDADEILFGSRSGELKVSRHDNRLALDFPAYRLEPATAGEKLLKGIGAEPLEVLASRDYLPLLKDEDTVRELKPDFCALEELDRLGIIVTARGNEVDFVSRFFAPSVGIPEDPVTGSAHCSLTPFWAEKLGKKKLHALQVSPRGGELYCELQGDRVRIAGNVTPYLQGYFEIPD